MQALIEPYLLEVLAAQMEYTMFLQLQVPLLSELSHLSQLPVWGKEIYRHCRRKYNRTGRYIAF